jgi:threonine dehydrogenase-like Zn-dependent dehydrogenase
MKIWNTSFDLMKRYNALIFKGMGVGSMNNTQNETKVTTKNIGIQGKWNVKPILHYYDISVIAAGGGK